MGSNYRNKKERINISTAVIALKTKPLKTHRNNADGVTNIEFTPINTITICRLVLVLALLFAIVKDCSSLQ